MSAESARQGPPRPQVGRARLIPFGSVIAQLWAKGVRRIGIAPERLAEVGRWWAVGLVFLVLNIPLLYVLRDGLALPLWLATLIGGEIGTLARFLVNDRWVFGNRRPTWRRAVQYHAAVASSFGIWWAVTNALAQVGIHYLVANIGGQAISVGWSMLTNFGWIWRRRRAQPTPGARADPLRS
jgi:putative flippase GtrA